MSDSVAGQVLVNAAGSTLGGPPGQIAGFFVVKSSKLFVRGVSIAPTIDEGQGFMSQMLEYIRKDGHLFSSKDRNELETAKLK